MINDNLKNTLEAALLAAGQPVSVNKLLELFAADEKKPAREDVKKALKALSEDYENRGIELVEVASGFRLQVRQSQEPWIAKLWDEKPPRYSRALLETLALIAYRQPITRAEIEDIRGVSVSTQIVKTMQEREWVRVVGHREVPGKPAMYGTTRQFLDYFNLKRLDDLPSLAEIRDLDSHPKLALDESQQVQAATDSGTDAGAVQEEKSELDDEPVTNVLENSEEALDETPEHLEEDVETEKIIH